MPKSTLTFDKAACKGCLLCTAVCPPKILELDLTSVNAKGYNPIYCTDIAKCTACAICARICPDSVIKVEREAASGAMSNVERGATA